MGVTEGDLYGVAGVFEESGETGSGRDGGQPLRGELYGVARRSLRSQVKLSLIFGARVMLQTLVGTSLTNRRR